MFRTTNNVGVHRHTVPASQIFLFLLWPFTVEAEELAVDEIFSPRITAGDLEIGVVGAFLDSQGSEDDNLRFEQWEIGYGITDRFSAELNFNANKSPGSAYSLKEYEIELVGNFFQDHESAAGLLLELSKEHRGTGSEIEIGPLYERQLADHYRILTNVLVSRSFGEDDEQLELTGSARAAYTKSETFQLALEYYGARNNHLLGPAILAEFRVGSSLLELQAGVVFGLSPESDDVIYRWELGMEM
ncbi:hypothetical protein [uncultured Marinobacter sp.]|uniref:hypothetical protein n=1 Tax=uncultured Marinobacter sp. TaxID=187379 RepID=UPI0030DA53D1|tara:strand:- start:33357 stop:34091 length:735 start_codon:yes stop_codon:yes gene_type:complete